MIIKKLRVCNFLVFPGTQTIELPTDKETNMVVILAPNNTGKTNIIRALKFLFYGHLPDSTEATAYRLIHDGVRDSANIGSELQAWVEVTLELEDEDLTLRRTIRTSKRGKDQWMPPEIYLGKFVQNPRPRVLIDSDGIYQTKLRTLVPEKLFDAFYFKGEPLDGKLLGGVGAIRESLASFLHEDRWEEVQEAVENIRQQYTNELKKLTVKNQDYTNLLNDEELFRNHMLKEQDTLARKKREQRELVGEFEDAATRLQELGTGGDAEKWVSQLRELRTKQDLARKAAEKADNEIIRLVGASRGVPFLLQAMPAARRILGQLVEDNVLPADVTERFVQKVVAAKICVCGREHTNATREAWGRYKEKTLSADLSRGLGELLNALQEAHSQSYARLSAESASRLKQAQDARSKAFTEIDQLSASIGDLEKKLQGSPIQDIRTLTQKLRDLTASRERIKGEIADLEGSISAAQKQLRILKDKMAKAKPSGTIAQKEKVIQTARTRAEALRLLIQQSRTVLTESFHAVLQQSVSEYYDTSAYDGSRAQINRSTLLPAIECNGHVHGNLGGGQSQLLALAYIVSLSRLRKSLHVQMQKLGVGLGKIDDQSFFLDSPFNHVTTTYADAIARFLDGNGKQVVLLLSRQQWDLVRSILEPAKPVVLAFRYHTHKDKIDELDPKDFLYQVGGRKLKLIEELPKTTAFPYTLIDPLK